MVPGSDVVIRATSGGASTPVYSAKFLLEVSLVRYVAVGCLSVYIWDILHSLASDYNLLFRRKFNTKTAAFVMSRIATLGYIAASCVQATTKVVNCHPLDAAICAFFAIARGLTALLFYFRVCAVYKGNRYVAGFFALTWLGVVGGATLTFSSGVESRGKVAKLDCHAGTTQKYLVASAIAELINDTLIFLAIVHKLSTSEFKVDTGKASWWKSFFKRPSSLRRVTEAFLQDSQIYFLVAVALNFATIITYFVANNPPTSPIRLMLVFPNTVIVNIMATKVYRNMRLGRPGLIPADKTTFNFGKLSFLRDTHSPDAAVQTHISGTTLAASSNPPPSPTRPTAEITSGALSFGTDLEAGSMDEKSSMGEKSSVDETSIVERERDLPACHYYPSR